MIKKHSALLLGILLLVAFIFFSLWYVDINRTATQEFRYLIYAIGSGIVALGLHCSRYIHAIKNNESILLIVDSIELLGLIMAPILSALQILIRDYPDHMFILFTVGVFSWWIIVVIRTNNYSGKFAFGLSANLYAGLLAIVALFAWLLPLLH